MTMRLPASLLVAPLALLLAVPAQAQQQTPAELAEKVAGCYEIEVGPWPDALDRDHDPDPAALPRHLWLSSTPFLDYRWPPDGIDVENGDYPARMADGFAASYALSERDPSRKIDRPLDRATPFEKGRPARGEGTLTALIWEAAGPDSLFVSYAIPLVGFNWRFRHDGDILRGRVIPFTDDGSANRLPAAPAVARPVPCPPEGR